MIDCKRIYLAGPLFSNAEREYNLKICEEIEALGWSVFLPQRDGLADISFEEVGWQEKVFIRNETAIDNASLVIAILDGSIVDDGTAWEVGYAYANNKNVVGLRTDFRVAGPEGIVNLMLERSIDSLFLSEIDLYNYLRGEC